MILNPFALMMDRIENHFWNILVISLHYHKTMKLSRAQFLLYMKETCKVANDFKITSIWWRCLVTSMVFLYSRFRVIEPYEIVMNICNKSIVQTFKR